VTANRLAMRRSSEAYENGQSVDPRAAEILLRWLQRPRTDERIHGVDLDAMSEVQLEALYAGLVRVAALSPNELQVLVQSLLADNEGAA
jgi:hypothetical protein